MARPRKHGVMLPEHVHKVTSGGREYYYWHPFRGTPHAGKSERIPVGPEAPGFWSFIDAKKGVGITKGTVSDLIAGYRGSPGYKALKPVSRRDYDRYLDLFEARLGSYAARDITAPVLLEMRDSLAETPVTANHLLSVLRTLFAWGVPRNKTATNPAREIEPLPIYSDGAAPWPLETIQMAFQHCRWEVRMFVALGYYTGQRTADILRMRLSSIAGHCIVVTQSKTGKYLEIPIHRDLRPFIEEAKRRGSMVLVPGPAGSELSTNRWFALWTREMAKEPQGAIRAAGLSPHGLRKSAVVALLEAGCTVKEVASITGQSLQIIEHYGKRYNQRITAERAMEKFENAGAAVLQMPAKASGK